MLTISLVEHGMNLMSSTREKKTWIFPLVASCGYACMCQRQRLIRKGDLLAAPKQYTVLQLYISIYDVFFLYLYIHTCPLSTNDDTTNMLLGRRRLVTCFFLGW